MIHRIAARHYGKLIVLGFGIVILPPLYTSIHGVPPAPALWVGLVWLAGLLTSSYGVSLWVNELGDH